MSGQIVPLPWNELNEWLDPLLLLLRWEKEFICLYIGSGFFFLWFAAYFFYFIYFIYFLFSFYLIKSVKLLTRSVRSQQRGRLMIFSFNWLLWELAGRFCSFLALSSLLPAGPSVWGSSQRRVSILRSKWKWKWNSCSVWWRGMGWDFLLNAIGFASLHIFLRCHSETSASYGSDTNIEFELYRSDCAEYFVFLMDSLPLSLSLSPFLSFSRSLRVRWC